MSQGDVSDDGWRFTHGAHPGFPSDSLRFTCHPDLLAASLVDSDDTADNLPGPGRNLGRLYGALGGRLTDFLNEKLSKLKHRPGFESEARSDAANEDTTEVPSHGTDSTASNLPGPGRTVGLLFGWLGKKFERKVNTFVVRRGAGRMRREHL